MSFRTGSDFSIERDSSFANPSNLVPLGSKQSGFNVDAALNPFLQNNSLLQNASVTAENKAREAPLRNRVAVPSEAGTSLSRKLYSEKMDGVLTESFIADVNRCIVGFSKEWQANSENFRKEIDARFQLYLQHTDAMNAKFSEYALKEADRIIAGGSVDQTHADAGKHLYVLCENVRKMYATNIQDLQSFYKDNSALIQSNASSWIAFLYSERFKYFDGVTKLLMEARTQETHEVNQWVEIQGAELKIQNQEFNQVMEAIKVKLAIDKQRGERKIQEAHLDLDRQKLEHAIDHAKKEILIARQTERNRHAETAERIANEREVALRRIRSQAAQSRMEEMHRHKEETGRLILDRQLQLEKIQQYGAAEERKETNRHEEVRESEETQRARLQSDTFLQSRSQTMNYLGLQMDASMRMAKMYYLHQ